MSSFTDPHSDPPPADELVAYLDGELSPDECRRVEERLAIDDGYRKQLHDLDQAWEALDSLPSAPTDNDFARTTMELVSGAAQVEAANATLRAGSTRRRRKLWYTLASIAGTLLGVVAALLLLPDPNQALLRDLPAIRHADILRLTGSTDFLRQLSEKVPPERLLNDEAALDAEREHIATLSSEPDSIKARRQWVESLSPDDKLILAGQAQRFRELQPQPQEQDNLRTLAREIHDAGPEIERTFLAYGQWLSSLTAGKQDELRREMQELDTSERVELVRRMVQREQDQISRKLSPDDARKLREALHAIVDERKAELLRELKRRGDTERHRQLEGPRGALAVLAREIWNKENRNEIRDKLLGELSPEARDHLESLPPSRRTPQLWRWIGESLQVKADTERLERFFAEKLDNELREQLLNLQPNEMQARLEQLYYATELGFGDAGQWRDEFRELRDSIQNRPGDGRGFRRDHPDRPPGARRGPDGPPPRPFDRDGAHPGGPPRGQGPRGPFEERPPFDRPGLPPVDGPPLRDRQPPPQET